MEGLNMELLLRLTNGDVQLCMEDDHGELLHHMSVVQYTESNIHSTS